MLLWRWLILHLNIKKGPISLSEISAGQNISLAYLEQIFFKLKNNKLVKSSRGAAGGYILEKPASEIKISNIIDAVDEEIKTLNCKKIQKEDAIINQLNVLHTTFGIN